MDSAPLSRALLWSARITGSVQLVFLRFMLVGHLTGTANGPRGMAFASSGDVLGFVLFPVCTIVGLVLAYRWPLLGGVLAVGGLALLLALRPDLLRSWFALMAIPGLLYLMYARLGRR